MFVASRRLIGMDFFSSQQIYYMKKLFPYVMQFTFKSKMGYLGSVIFLGAHMGSVLDFYQIFLEDTARKMIKDGGWPMMNVKDYPINTEREYYSFHQLVCWDRFNMSVETILTRGLVVSIRRWFRLLVNACKSL